MTDKELLDYSGEHLMHELRQLYRTAERLINDPAVLSDLLVKDALIESFAIHGRSLAIFLYPEAAKTWSTNVTAEHYVKGALPQWKAARGALPPALKSTIERTGKEIAHLTSQRQPPGHPDKVWRLNEITDAFIPPLKAFLAHVPPGRLQTNVTQFITALTPSAHSPATGQAPAPPSGSFTTSVPTGRIVGSTDVSTP